MNTTFHKTSARHLEIAVIAFFMLMLLSLCVIYVVDPSIYLQTLKLAPSPANRFPWPATLFLVCLITFLGVLSIGVLRHWRWTFWLILVAFSASVLQFPAELLQIFGVLPLTSPLWYSLFRLAVAVLELGLAVWMIQVYRHEGIWALGAGGFPIDVRNAAVEIAERMGIWSDLQQKITTLEKLSFCEHRCRSMPACIIRR